MKPQRIEKRNSPVLTKSPHATVSMAMYFFTRLSGKPLEKKLQEIDNEFFKFCRSKIKSATINSLSDLYFTKLGS